MNIVKNFFLYLFSIILWVIWWISAIILIDLSIVLSLLTPKRFWDLYVKIICFVLTFCVFIFPRHRGINPKQVSFPVIYAANHVSFFDLFILGTMLPGNPRGLELAHHFRLPFYGWFLKRFGQIPIEVGSKKSLKNSIVKIIEIIKNKRRNILIMPEGRRTKNGKIGIFKTGAFFISRKTGVPIVPVVLKGLYKINNLNSIIIKPGFIDVNILDPVYPEDFSIDDEMAQYVRELIRKKLEEDI